MSLNTWQTECNRYKSKAHRKDACSEAERIERDLKLDRTQREQILTVPSIRNLHVGFNSSFSCWHLFKASMILMGNYGRFNVTCLWFFSFSREFRLLQEKNPINTGLKSHMKSGVPGQHKSRICHNLVCINWVLILLTIQLPCQKKQGVQRNLPAAA